MRRVYASGDWVIICYTKVMAFYHLNQCWLFNWTLRLNFSGMLTKTKTNFISRICIKNVGWEIPAIISRPLYARYCGQFCPIIQYVRGNMHYLVVLLCFWWFGTEWFYLHRLLYISFTEIGEITPLTLIQCEDYGCMHHMSPQQIIIITMTS